MCEVGEKLIKKNRDLWGLSQKNNPDNLLAAIIPQIGCFVKGFCGIFVLTPQPRYPTALLYGRGQSNLHWLLGVWSLLPQSGVRRNPVSAQAGFTASR